MGGLADVVGSNPDNIPAQLKKNAAEDSENEEILKEGRNKLEGILDSMESESDNSEGTDYDVQVDRDDDSDVSFAGKEY